MRFLLTPVGSSGDVHPYVGLGRVLRARGHEVVLVTAEPFRALAEGAGLRFEPVGTAEEFRRGMEDPALWGPRSGPRLVFGMVGDLLGQAYAALERLHAPGETVLVGHSLAFATRIFEEDHGLPAATIHLAPSPIRSVHAPAVSPPGVGLSPLPFPAKAALWWALDRWAIDPLIAPRLNAFRRTLGLPPVRRVFRDWLHSPQRVIGFFPEWFAPPPPDWPAGLTLVGFPLWDEGEGQPLDPDLDRWIGARGAPLAFTPGTGNLHAARFLRQAVEIGERLPRPVLLLTRFREQVPDPLPGHARWVPYAPFSSLLPRCAALVHHGGIGTCAQALAAGLPQLVRPLAFDQFDNAARVARLGAGEVLPAARFTPARAADALGRLLGPEVAGRCRALAPRVRADRGLERAADLLESMAAPCATASC